MVNPSDAYAQTLGIAPPPTGDQRGRITAPQLFTLALMRAGRDGCTCQSCRYLMQLEDIMAEEVERPFQQPAATAPPAPSPAPASAPAPAPPAPAPGPPPQATPPAVSQEPPGV